jgi:hypothetical protein
VGAIDTTLSVDAGGALGELEAFAGAVRGLAADWNAMEADLAKGINPAGLGGLADSMTSAAGAIDSAVSTAVGSLGKLGATADSVAGQIGTLGEAGKGLSDITAGAAGAADSLKVVGDSAAVARDELAGAADTGKAVAESNDAIAGSADPAATGIKAVGAASADAAAAQGDLAKAGKAVVDTNADVAASAKASADAQKAQADAAALAGKAQADAAKAQADAAAWSAETASISADAGRASAAGQAEATLGIARSNSVLADSYAAVGTTSIEQDAAVTQGIRAKKAAAEDAAASAETAGEKYKLIGLAGLAVTAVSIDQAAKYQTSMTKLVTTAGELKGNLPEVSSGLLKMAPETGTTPSSLAAGAYWTESAGFHGQRELAVEKPEAQAAYAEGADLPTVAGALTTILTDYGMISPSARKQSELATQATNEMIASVGLGKMTVQGESAALPAVLPGAKTAGLSLPQILGAMSALTAQGTSPDEAAQELRGTIRAVGKPSGIQSAEMQMLGINPLQLSQALGKSGPGGGLTGVVGEIDTAIAKHTDKKTGLVDLDTMNQSVLAVKSANEEVAKLPENLQGVAKGYLDGTTTKAQFYALTGSKSTLSERDVNLLDQFATTANKALGFNSLVKSGMGDQQTKAAALNELLGGQGGQQVGQMLGGANFGTTKSDVDAIASSAKKTGDNINGWPEITKQFNFQLDSAKAGVEAVGDEFGAALLPSATAVLHVVSNIGGFLANNQGLTKALAVGIGGLGAVWTASKLVSGAGTALSDVGKLGQALNIPGAGKLAGIGQGSSAAGTAGTAGLDSAAGSLDGAAGSLQGAAGSLEGAAGKLGTAGAAGDVGDAENAIPRAPLTEPAAGEPSPAVPVAAAGEEEAGLGESENLAKGGGILGALGLTGGTDIGAALNPMGLGLGLALFTKGLSDSAAPAGTPAGKINRNLQKNPGTEDSGMMPYIFGGFESKLALSHFGQAIGGFLGHAIDRTTPAVPVSATESRFTGTGYEQRAAPAAAPAEVREAPAAGYTADTLKIGEASAASIKVKIQPEIDSGSVAAAMASVKTKASEALTGSSSSMTPIKVPAPDLSALDLAKAKAASAAAGIMSAIRSGTGGASSIGASMDTGLAAGIAGGAGAAIAAAHAVASEAAAAMSHALDAHSPSRVTKAIGSEEFDKGFADGIGDDAQVKAAATGLSKSAVASLTAGLQGGASAIAAAKALATGVATPFKDSTIADTITKMEDDVAKALKKHKIDKSEDSAMVAYLKADETKLQALAKQRSSLESQIQQAQSYASNITSSANQGASIVNIASTAESTEAGNAPTPVVAPQMNDLVSGMQSQIAQTKQFNSDIAKLKKEGLNKSQLDQIMQAGAATGDPIAQTILASGKSGIAELNKLAAQMNTAAHQLGVTAGNAMTEPASEIGGKLAQGLKNQLGTVDKSISGLAAGMTSAINAALGSGAGAAAFTAGQKIASELAAGVSSGAGSLATAIGAVIDAALDEATTKAAKKKKEKGGNKDIELGAPVSAGSAGAYSGAPDSVSHPAAAVPHPASAVPSGGGGGGGGGGSITHQSTTILQMDGAEISRIVQDHTIERSLNNLGSGLQVPGRTT